GEGTGFKPASSISQGGRGKLALGFGRLEGRKDGGGSAHEPQC
ncbi:MAG: hypothetical protein RLZ70_1294, partial [Verrucomicrobiota bacterium]